MRTRHLSFLFLALFLSAAAGDSHVVKQRDHHHDKDECVYTLYVKTGSIFKGGTNSNISVTLGDVSGKPVWVPNLKRWGLMNPGHNYFERGNLDVFTGRGSCIGSPVCRLNLTSDGAGSHHGWFCDYVEVTSTGPHKRCSQTVFYVDQWLADDAPPFQLTAVVDGCGGAAGVEERGKLVVRNPKHESM